MYNKYAGMTPGEIESAKRANETPEQTRKRHERERQAAIIEGEEARRQAELARLRGGWDITPFRKPWSLEDVKDGLETDIRWIVPKIPIAQWI